MKKRVIIALLLFAVGFFGVYGQTKNDDILKLLRVTGTDKLADQMMDALIPQFKQLIPDIPDQFWARFRGKMNTDDLLFACVPAYSKYYSHDEIKQLLAFYESPLGKRLIEVTPLLTQDTMLVGQKWGEQLGTDIANELIKEGYIKN